MSLQLSFYLHTECLYLFYSIFYEPREFYSNVTNLIESDKGGVAVAMGWKVTKIDVINKTVTLENGYEINYNKCLIATGKFCSKLLSDKQNQNLKLNFLYVIVFAGASPKNLPIFESAEDNIKDKVTTFRTKDNFLDLEENVSNPKCKNVVVIGGGFLGSELACALARSCKFFIHYQNICE